MKPILISEEKIKQDIVDFIKSKFNGNIFSLKKGWVRQNEITKYICEKYKIADSTARMYLNELVEQNKLFPVIRTKYFDGGRYYAPAGFPLYFTVGLFGTIILIFINLLINYITNLSFGIYPLYTSLLTLWIVCTIWALSIKYES